MQLNEKNHAGGFILSEANGSLSRALITIALGQNLQAGTVLGELTATPGTFAIHDPAAADGTAAAAGVLYDNVDATDAAAPGVAIVRMAEVNENELVWLSGISAPNKALALADLATKHVIAR